jgi:serine/threonine protein kinase
MDDHELDKTFVERSPSSLIPSPYAHSGNSAPQSNARPIIGQTRFGSCVVTEIIGEGGMATVYKVWNERLEVYRAVKLLSQEAFSARFETEAKITAKLHHAGIVEIHNIGEWNGLPYMEMEFVDGFDLQQTLAVRGRLPEIVCVAIAVRVAEALAHAHTKVFTLVGKQYCGIIHRDLKPANIMISKHGEVKLTDFGIARPAQTSLHTIEGNIAGTMHYLSPEQMNGGDVDNRSDIYSFGTILYEMVTGAKTFPQEALIELMKQKSANKFKSLYEYGLPVSADLVKIILRCLKFTPAKRYQRTQDLVNDLQELNESLTKRAPKDVVECYLNGPEEAIRTDSGQTKLFWILGEPKTPKPATTQKPSEVLDVLNMPEPEETPQPVTTTNVPEATAFLDMPEFDDKPTIWTMLSAIIAWSLKVIFFVPLRIWGKIKVIGTSTKPKPAKKSAKPMPAQLSERPKTGIRLTRWKVFVAPLLLLTVLLLSYITIRVFTAKTVTTKPTKTPPLINAITVVDTVKTVAVIDTAPPVRKTMPNTAKVTKSISSDAAIPVPTPAPPQKVAVVKTPPQVPAVAEPDNISENEQLRAAVAAANTKKWDRAIEILEQPGVFKAKNDHRALQLLNAYVESRRFDKAQDIMNTASPTLSQDAYFHLCVGKFWYYRGSPDKALKHFEMSLNRSSILEDTDDVIPGTALYFIADIKHERFKTSPSAANRSAALEAWREVRSIYVFKPNDSRAKRAEREISVLDIGN